MFSPSMAWLSSRALILGICFSFVTGGAALQAQSAVLVVDAFNKKVHVAADAQAKRAVGGLAKIATAMVTLDWAEASQMCIRDSLRGIPCRRAIRRRCRVTRPATPCRRATRRRCQCLR